VLQQGDEARQCVSLPTTKRQSCNGTIVQFVGAGFRTVVLHLSVKQRPAAPLLPANTAGTALLRY
jgi:hypothetical protein